MHTFTSISISYVQGAEAVEPELAPDMDPREEEVVIPLGFSLARDRTPRARARAREVEVAAEIYAIFYIC